MKIRPYNHASDFAALRSWVTDERLHALWCANRIPYPLTSDGLNGYLEGWMDAAGMFEAFTAVLDSGEPAGFFVCRTSSRSVFLQFIILAPELRGMGYGTQMLKLALRCAFELCGVEQVHLNVFDVNTGARRCYYKAGFAEVGIEPDVFPYKEERWVRCHMVASKCPKDAPKEKSTNERA